jgi:hypothetical protein
MGILTDWYIHNRAVLSWVTGCVSPEETFFLKYELNRLLENTPNDTILVLYLDEVRNKDELCAVEMLKSLKHPRLKQVIFCGDVNTTLAHICKDPQLFGLDMECRILDDWYEVLDYLEGCNPITPIDIENAEDLLELNGWC